MSADPADRLKQLEDAWHRARRAWVHSPPQTSERAVKAMDVAFRAWLKAGGTFDSKPLAR